jgi:hypothetical protein
MDDLWEASGGELFVVDYKATASAKTDLQTLDAEYRQGYKRQLEFYQFLLRKNDFAVFRRAFVVYAVGDMARPSFDNQILFGLQLIEHLGDTEWIEPTLMNIKATLMSDVPPPASTDCENCKFVAAVNEALRAG